MKSPNARPCNPEKHLELKLEEFTLDSSLDDTIAASRNKKKRTSTIKNTGNESPTKKVKKIVVVSPKPRKFESEPIPPLSLEHAVMLVSAVIDDGTFTEQSEDKSMYEDILEEDTLTDEHIESLLKL